MRETILKKLAHWHAIHPWKMFVTGILLTVILGGFAGQLSITMRTSDLLPEKDERVVQYNTILDEFITASNIVIVVQGDEKQMKEFADRIAPRILELRDDSNNNSHQKRINELEEKLEKLQSRDNKEAEKAKLKSEIDDLHRKIDMKLFQRVDYKAEVDFLRNHAFMLIKEDDLENTKDVFIDPNLTDLIENINNSMEKEYVGQEESISTREQEDGAVSFLDGIQNLTVELHSAVSGEKISEDEVHKAVDKLLLGEPYMLSYDKSTLILAAIPNFTLMDRDYIMSGTRAVQSLVDNLLQEYPGLKAGLSGAIAKEHDEQVYSMQSLGYTSIIALFAILILLIVSFKMWVAPVFAILTLIVGLIWALGASFILVRQLNMMTSVMSIALLGLGIDFAIHFISGFTEWRAAGDSIALSMEKTFLKSGKGILTGGLTTACAFLALIISRSRGMKEMGIVVAIGLLAVLLATVLFLPVLLVFRERLIDKKREKKKRKEKFIQKDISFRFLGHAGEWLGKRYKLTLIIAALVSVLLIWSAFQIEFDYNFLSMEPEGLTSIALMDTVLHEFDLSMDYAFILTESIEESREFSEKLRDLGTIALTDDISIYLPSEEEQQKRIPHISEIYSTVKSASIRRSVTPADVKTLLKEFERLEMNIMEIQDMAFLGGQDKVDNKCKEIVGDPDKPESRNIIREFLTIQEKDIPKTAGGFTEFQRYFAPYFKSSVLQMCSTTPLYLNELPVTILDKYSNKNRNWFLITVYPGSSLWDKETITRFVDDLEKVSDKATGTYPLGLAMINIFGQDGRNAIILTLIIVVLLLWVDFKKFRYALIAMIPLAFGFFWMIGFMNLTRMELTIMGVVGFPLIIGIGIDDGVHIMHRWTNEGNGKIRTIFASTGKAIFLTSLTTMIAFGSMLFSVFPAWSQFGTSLFIGVGTCFLTSVIILPGIIGLVEKKNKMKT